MLLDIQGDINVIKNTMNELKKLSDEEKINLPRDVYLRNIFCHDCSLKKTCGNAPCENYEYWKEGYEKGLTETDKLKAQIEKMKNCANCKNGVYGVGCMVRAKNGICNEYNKWECVE